MGVNLALHCNVFIGNTIVLRRGIGTPTHGYNQRYQR